MLSLGKTQQLFQSGNYTQVARLGHPLAWEKYAAFALIGKTTEAIAYFQNHRHNTNTNFYEGVAYWMHGDDRLACQLLEKVPTTHAQNLLKLIQQPKITVLAQIPWIRNHFTDWLAGVEDDPKFLVKNISFHPDDIPNQPYADIHQFYNPQAPPDFYICQMVEWHLIPPNLQELSCPLFGQTADYDLHIQAVYPWLQLFDELLVTDSTEWKDVSKLVSVPVSTFPKTFCLLRTLPELELKPRPIDLYLSGTVTHPYHPDKAHLLSQILRVPGLNIKVIHGFTSTDEYYENLSSSKVCFTYVRHPGATPTRGLEALSLGCGLVTQKESTLKLFVGEKEGVLTYSYDEEDLTQNLLHIAQNWSDYQWKAHRCAKIIRREFSANKVASQFLRYLTVLAAKPGITKQRKKINYHQLVQKRTVLHKGWLPSHDFKHSKVFDEINKANLLRLSDIESIENSSPRIAIDQAREITLFHYHRSINILSFNPWLKDIERIYKNAIANSPTSLVLRFNFIRTLIHFGNPIQVSQAINAAMEVLHESPKYWSINCLEDVFPYDIFSNYFNYRDYFDCVLESLTSDDTVQEKKLIQIILASIHYYLGFYTQNSKYFLAAIEFDPSFAKYRLSYIKKEFQKDFDLKQNIRLKTMLISLSKDTTEFLQAYKIIHEQALSNKKGMSQFLDAEIQPIFASIQDIETASVDLLRPSIAIVLNPLKYREFTQTLLSTYILYIRDSITSYVRKFISYVLDIPEHDIYPFAPAQNTTLEELQERIRAMKSSKFLYLSRFLGWDNQDSLNNLNTESLLHKIREIESKPAWRLRVYWLIMKLRIKTHLLYLNDFLADYRSNSDAIKPKLIYFTRYYNLVIWKEYYYGIPKSLGYIDLYQIDMNNNREILVESSFRNLRRRIQALQKNIRLKSLTQDIKPYYPPDDRNRKLLCDRITAMRSSKFLIFEPKKCDEDSSQLNSEELMAEIRRLEKTRAWRLRVLWLRIKWRVIQIR
ncbi:MAG: glycosyltransferase [Spirulina sp. SIO3F2]|nr:glycosyltransferase [Spirulina sp. SIO3F2]